MTLQGLDDMESDLFGGSLGKKTTPKKPTKSAKPASEPKKINTDDEQPLSVDATTAKISSTSSAKCMFLPVGIVNKNYSNNNFNINSNSSFI